MSLGSSQGGRITMEREPPAREWGRDKEVGGGFKGVGFFGLVLCFSWVVFLRMISFFVLSTQPPH